jgi:glutathione S-transferase
MPKTWQEGNNAMITVSAFAAVPPFAQGLVRDLRVRWALEEAGIAYKAMLIGPSEQSSEAYRACQPFGQVPIYREGDLTLFESGAIVVHIGERSKVLLPADEAARARAITWLFCALNTMEVVIQQLSELDLFFPGEDWAKQHRPAVEQRVKLRLEELAEQLGEREYLDGQFTAGDLMMTTVLRILRHTDLVEREPRLAAYVKRCEARPAFRRALEAQMEGFSRIESK